MSIFIILSYVLSYCIVNAISGDKHIISNVELSFGSGIHISKNDISGYPLYDTDGTGINGWYIVFDQTTYRLTYCCSSSSEWYYVSSPGPPSISDTISRTVTFCRYSNCATPQPTPQPTPKPTNQPTSSPTKYPSNIPTTSPITSSPTNDPSKTPTTSPPSVSPTNYPSNIPTSSPITVSPTSSSLKTSTSTTATKTTAIASTDLTTKDTVQSTAISTATKTAVSSPQSTIKSITSNNNQGSVDDTSTTSYNIGDSLEENVNMKQSAMNDNHIIIICVAGSLCLICCVLSSVLMALKKKRKAKSKQKQLDMSQLEHVATTSNIANIVINTTNSYQTHNVAGFNQIHSVSAASPTTPTLSNNAITTSFHHAIDNVTNMVDSDGNDILNEINGMMTPQGPSYNHKLSVHSMSPSPSNNNNNDDNDIINEMNETMSSKGTSIASNIHTMHRKGTGEMNGYYHEGTSPYFNGQESDNNVVTAISIEYNDASMVPPPVPTPGMTPNGDEFNIDDGNNHNANLKPGEFIIDDDFEIK